MTALDVIAALLVAMAVVNLYFVWHGYRMNATVHPRSSVLRALFGVNLTVWLVGAFIGLVALRTLLNLPPLPFDGLGVGIAILILELLPAYIWLQMRHFVEDGNHE